MQIRLTTALGIWFSVTVASGHAQGDDRLKETAKFTTPQAAFDAYRQAREKNDLATAYHCVVPAARIELVNEMFQALNLRPNDEKAQAVLSKHAPTPYTKDTVNKIADKLGFVKAAAEVAKPATDMPPRWGELKKINIANDKATGQATFRIYRVEAGPGKPDQTKFQDAPISVSFRKSDGVWLLEHPY